MITAIWPTPIIVWFVQNQHRWFLALANDSRKSTVVSFSASLFIVIFHVRNMQGYMNFKGYIIIFSLKTEYLFHILIS